MKLTVSTEQSKVADSTKTAITKRRAAKIKRAASYAKYKRMKLGLNY